MQLPSVLKTNGLAIDSAIKLGASRHDDLTPMKTSYLIFYLSLYIQNKSPAVLISVKRISVLQLFHIKNMNKAYLNHDRLYLSYCRC